MFALDLHNKELNCCIKPSEASCASKPPKVDQYCGVTNA